MNNDELQRLENDLTDTVEMWEDAYARALDALIHLGRMNEGVRLDSEHLLKVLKKEVQ